MQILCSELEGPEQLFQGIPHCQGVLVPAREDLLREVHNVKVDASAGFNFVTRRGVLSLDVFSNDCLLESASFACLVEQITTAEKCQYKGKK